MSKRVLAVLILFGLIHPLVPGFIKTASAAITISNPKVNGPNTQAGATASYSVDFDLGATGLVINDSVTVTFRDFEFSSTTFVNAPANRQLSCSVQIADRKGTCTNTSGAVIPSGSHIMISVLNIKNPAVGSYPVLITGTSGGAANTIISITSSTPPPSTSGTSVFEFPGFSCDNPFLLCIPDVALYIPKFLLAIVFGIIRTILQAILSGLIGIGWLFVKFSVFMNGYISDPNSMAKIGFDITRDITNVGFVLVIIIIGFATILRRENYAMKAALPRFILTALLINFSWYIAITLVDVSTTVGGAITNLVLGQSNPFSAENSPTYFNAYSSFDATQLPGGKITGFFADLLGGVLNGLIATFSQVIFGLMSFFALTATAVMLLIRYIVLSFLIILLPLALLMNIFPGQTGYFEELKKHFTKWLLFYPFTMFFIAVAMKAQQALPVDAMNPLSAVGNSLLVSGIFIAGLLVASKLGIEGAEAARNVSGWATRKLALNPAARFLGRRLAPAGAAAGGASVASAGLGGGPVSAGGAGVSGQLPLAPAITTGVPVSQSIGFGAGILKREGAGFESGLMQPSKEPKPEKGGSPRITPGMIKRATSPFKPGFRERAAANLLKYSLGGSSLGHILKESIPKDLGIFGEVKSMEGAEKAEEKLKKSKEVAEKLEEKFKKVEDLEREIGDLYDRREAAELTREDNLKAIETLKLDIEKAITEGKTADKAKHEKSLEIEKRKTKQIDQTIGRIEERLKKKTNPDPAPGEEKGELEKARAKIQGIEKKEVKAAKELVEKIMKPLKPEEPRDFKATKK